MQGKYRLIVLASALLLIGAGCSQNASVTADTELELKQERMMTYREECQAEWQAKLDAVDKTVGSNPNITAEQAGLIARNAGITDENNYVLDADVWVKGCMDKKAAVFE